MRIWNQIVSQYVRFSKCWKSMCNTLCVVMMYIILRCQVCRIVIGEQPGIQFMNAAAIKALPLASPSSSKELAVMETIDFLLLMLPRINGQEENGQEKENGRFGWDGLFSCANGDAAVTNGGNGYHQLKRVGWCMKKRRTQTSKTLFKF
ncbi:hypothetical protein OUZ56_027847 [Daphnia magna]|uniref:Uncharacterized protein n=1 Tax=Daphnia magna TaxID=35525 RepID=A0ABR0B242_9CRUS|nr:hypothetical protein OUZ56_027847 [Daphnia magna]